MFSERQVDTVDGKVNLACGPASGEPLLFLHGVGRCWQDFGPLAAALGWRWQVFALDFRGHGASEPTSGKYLVRDYQRDVVTAVREAIGRPVVLYGHSLGAMVAAAVAAELPDEVRGAVLEDPPFETMGPLIKGTSYHSMFTAMRAISGPGRPVTELAQLLGNIRINAPERAQPVRLSDARDATSLRFMAASLRHVDPELWDPIIDGRWLVGYDKPATLRKIRCPVLLLQGNVTEGGTMSEAAAAEVESLIADCTRIRVARAGHLIHNMQHETTLRLTSAFLESVALE
jgi:pimeloyl-ACP methyl ester carboxylesterase